MNWKNKKNPPLTANAVPAVSFYSLVSNSPLWFRIAIAIAFLPLPAMFIPSGGPFVDQERIEREQSEQRELAAEKHRQEMSHIDDVLNNRD